MVVNLREFVFLAEYLKEMARACKILYASGPRLTHMKRIVYYVQSLVLVAFGLLSLSLSAQKVVFIGDPITYYWASAFAANPDWINEGNPNPDGPTFAYGSAASVLARFQSDVVSLHPAIVHILIGQGDADGYNSDEGQTGQAPAFVAGVEAIVQEAKAANIRVVLGMEPLVATNYLPLEPFNSIIASYGAANNIPVINYADALCNCIGARTGANLGASVNSLIGVDTFQQYGGGAYIAGLVRIHHHRV